MPRYSHLVWLHSRSGWARTLLVVGALLVLGSMGLGIAAAVVEGTTAVADAGPIGAVWPLRLVAATSVHGVVLCILAFTQRALRRRSLRTYVTAAPSLRWNRLWWGAAVGAGIVGVTGSLGAALGWVGLGGTGTALHWSLAVLVLLVPVQVAVEEVVRGVALQTLLKRTRRGWAAVVGAAVLIGGSAAVAGNGLEVGVPTSTILWTVTATGLLAGLVTLLDDGMELAMGARMGGRVLLVATVGGLPLQVHAPGAWAGSLVAAGVGALVVGTGWTGWSVPDVRRVLGRVAPPDDTAESTPAPDTHRCLNCGADLVGPYCHACGQKGVDRNQSLSVLLPEVADVLFEVDSRIWRTVRILLTRPGLLTRYYNGGRREEFVRPFRVYIAFSFLFFVVLVSFPPGSTYGPFASWRSFGGAFSEGYEDAQAEVEVDGRVDAVRVADSVVTVEGVSFTVAADADYSDRVPSLDGLRVGQYVSVEGSQERDMRTANEFDPADSTDLPEMEGPVDFVGADAVSVMGVAVQVPDSVVEAEGPSLSDLRVDDRIHVTVRAHDGARVATDLRRVGDGFANRVAAGEVDALKALIQNFSRAMFFLVPLFGLVLQALYIRDPYVSHLIFALHEHAFIFLTGTIIVLVGLIPGTWLWVVQIVLAAGVPVYLVLSLRAAYGESWLGAFVKGLFVLATYVVLLVLGIGFTVGFLSI